MKMSIEWHKRCHKTVSSSLEDKWRELHRLTAQIDALSRKNNIRLAQIRLAEKEGKDGFDREKYALKRLGLK